LALQNSALTIVLSLAEAESLRRYLQCWYRHQHGVSVHVALREGIVLDSARRGMRTTVPLAHRASLRFFDGVMWFNPAEVEALLAQVDGVASAQRRAFFEHLLLCRRRGQSNWRDTPLAKVFQLPNVARLQELRDKVAALRVHLMSSGGTVVQMCETMDDNGDGWLSVDEIVAAMATVPERCRLTRQDVRDIVRV